MKKIKYFLFAAILVFVLSCNSNSKDDCTKTIIVQYEYNITTQYGSIYYPEITQEVPCDFPDPDLVGTITSPPKLKEFSYEILELSIITDTGNNTSKISYKIQLNNLSNNLVNGLPYLTVRLNNDSSTVSYAFKDGCSVLEANSNCIISYEAEDSLDLGIITAFSIENVEYLIIK
ncbi:hypothetical protein [uncultured Polaribacter sp.]|uniref:hypothetical protein n=1 Tax=uncultured Polaribacter sp. TaxID=174711 RepID=UPI00262472BB|nr:hypothetical protein [uncultured Polaribacter sp.]